MKNWTPEELEKLYKEANEKAIADPAFRQELLADPKATLEKMAGCALPDDPRLKAINADPNFMRNYSVPDFVQGELNFEELDMEEMGKVSAGISFFLLASVCAGAFAVGPCGADACGANACAANACAGNACGADACGGNACGANAGGGGACAGAACGADACGANAGCAAYASGTDVCGAYTDCAAYATA